MLNSIYSFHRDELVLLIGLNHYLVVVAEKGLSKRIGGGEKYV